MVVKVFLSAAFAGTLLMAAPASAQTVGGEAGVNRSALAAHAEAKSKRARTRIRVTPRCPYRTQSLPYPAPNDCEFPGPGFVRQCAAQLVQENRPSGAVIVPRMNCWWERG